MCSARLNSHILLTVVLAGDGRLLERLRSDEFLPLASRMRVRLAIERATPDELQEYLRQVPHKAGAVKLMTPELDRDAKMPIDLVRLTRPDVSMPELKGSDFAWWVETMKQQDMLQGTVDLDKLVLP